MRRPNEAIIRERHLIPKIDEMLSTLHGAKYFTKLDLADGYLQLELHPESRDITSFMTHKGMYRFKRLLYGANVGFECFQKQVEQVLAGIDNVINISDDITVYGSTIQEHDATLRKVLDRIRDYGLTLNLKKCKFRVTEIVFAGYKVSANGISLEESRVQTIMEMPEPTNATEVRSFLGMVNYCNKFIPDYSTISAPLRELTKKNTRFVFGRQQREAFDTLKQCLVSADVMAFYNPNATTKLIVDASPVGLGAILAQEQEDKSFKPIMYGSSALSPVQKRYSQTEREGLAVLWGCEHFNHYLFDRQFTVGTDHKPLLNMLSQKAEPPARIQKWMMKLQAYSYDLEHIPGKEMAADYLSRHPSTDSVDEEASEHFVNMLVADCVPKASSIKDIQAATKKDAVLQKVITGVLTDKWELDDQTKKFYNIRESLSTKNGILLKGTRIVIPQQLQNNTLQLAHHTQHQGVEKTRALLREKVWWPSMNAEVEEKVKNCHACQVTKPQDLKCQPLKMSEIPKTSWHTLAMDIQGPYPGGTTSFSW